MQDMTLATNGQPKSSMPLAICATNFYETMSKKDPKWANKDFSSVYQLLRAERRGEA